MMFLFLLNSFHSGRVHNEALKLLTTSNLSLSATKPSEEGSKVSAESSTTTKLSTEDPNFIPLVEAHKRKKILHEEAKQLKVPAQIIEERWRAKPLVISEIMKELERLRVAGDEKDSARAVVMRRNVAACLKIAMSKSLLDIPILSILTLGRSLSEDIRLVEAISMDTLPLSCHATVYHASRMAHRSCSWPGLWIQLADCNSWHMGITC